MATVIQPNDSGRRRGNWIASREDAGLRRSRLFGITLMLVLAAVMGLIIALA